MDKNIENYLKDSNIRNIINSVSNKFMYALDHNDISSIAMVTLWKCIEKYDPTKGAKFTSYLYQQLLYALKNELKKKNIEYASDSIEQPISFSIKNEVFDILESLPSGMKTLLEQRFFHNMTMTEIADENGYSRETARRRLKKAIRMCKNLVKS
jgi:RNA polymerase sigma factor (sigma-70 family)